MLGRKKEKDLTKNEILCLNHTAAVVWKNCNGRNSIEQIAEILSAETKEIVSDEIVELAIENLKKANLIENESEIQTKIARLSRREAIRRIGLSSTVLLPVISFIVAPTVAEAQSCLPNGTVRTCTNTAPGCVQISISPQIFRCPDAACCSGFCAIETPNPIGNCAA